MLEDIKCGVCGHPITKFCQELIVVSGVQTRQLSDGYQGNLIEFTKQYQHLCPNPEEWIKS